MAEHGPYHRAGVPGGPGCQVAVIPISGRVSGSDEIVKGSLLDGGPDASEVELLRTVAHCLGIAWGHDEIGWWAMVPNEMRCDLTSSAKAAAELPFALYREDEFATREEADAKAKELAIGGHKQHYFVEA